MWKAIAAAQHWGMLFENMLFACNTPLTSSNSTDAVHQPVNAIGQSHRGAHQSVNTTMSPPPVPSPNEFGNKYALGHPWPGALSGPVVSTPAFHFDLPSMPDFLVSTQSQSFGYHEFHRIFNAMHTYWQQHVFTTGDMWQVVIRTIVVQQEFSRRKEIMVSVRFIILLMLSLSWLNQNLNAEYWWSNWWYSSWHWCTRSETDHLHCFVA